jgi:hypothetical protein
MGGIEISRFLSYLATDKKVAAGDSGKIRDFGDKGFGGDNPDYY